MRFALLTLSLVASLVTLYGCGGPDCAAPEYGSCTRDFEHHGASELAHMDWLVGRWRATDRAGRVHEQRWSPATGGIMLGYARTHHADRDLGATLVRVEVRRSGITYSSHAEAQMPGVPFTFDGERSRDGELHFENAEHDFPTRIVYRQRGANEMVVRLENDEQHLTRTYTRSGAERLVANARPR